MTFEKQVEKAKRDKLQFRLIRDITFIFLGIIFLIISFIVSFKHNSEEKKDTKTDKIVTTKKEK